MIMGNTNFNIPCPNCNKDISIKVKDVGTSIICPNCNQSIELKDNGFTDKINEANSMLKNLFK